MGIHSLLRITLFAALFTGIIDTGLAACLQDVSNTSPSPGAPAKPCGGDNCVSESKGPVTSPTPLPASSENPPADTSMSLKKAFLNLPGDQKAIWTSPMRLRWKDAIWLAPLAGTTGILIGSDQHSMQRARSNADAVDLSKNVSDVGVASLVAVPALMYAWGSWHGESRPRETGLLSGEALVNSLAVSEVLKVAFARQRPTSAGGKGQFFTDISNASFPSQHSMLSWTAASVIAHEYPGPVTQVLAYGGAAAVWLIGHQVYKAHHDTELGAPAYGSFFSDTKELGPEKLGSPFVPLDSW